MTCSVCNHPDRAAIENAVLSIDGVDFTLDSISKAYDIKEQDLKIHALMHMQVAAHSETTESLVTRIKLREAEQLRNTANSFYTTLKKLEANIQLAIAISNKSMVEAQGYGSGSEDAPSIVPLNRLIGKETVDAYIGCGTQIREANKALVEIDSIINDRAGGANQAILTLIEAVRGSRKPKPSQE